ncbi:MAG: ATP-dependent zinc metalloprotease FtsH [Oscillospiraceae bacterium]|jgi:cell division protease FtsH|nr:ATP-dependent zinc metalloprotease FtsH [Oscillospiraceae bacterium]
MPTPGPNRPNTPNNKKPPTPMPGGPGKRGTMLLLSLMWLVMAFLVMFNLMGGAAAGEKIEYGTFRQMVTEGKIARVVMTSEKYLIYPKLDGKGNYATPEGPVTGPLVDPMEELEEARKVLEELRSSTPPPIDDVVRREAYQAALGSAQASVAALERSQNADAPYYCVPLSGDITLVTLLEENGVTHYSVENPSVFSSLFWTLLPMLLMVGLMYLLFRSLSSKMGGMGGIGGVGKANAKVYVEKETGVTFRDVAGQDEAKESLQEIIDILHNPQKYTEIGAKLPKGVLLVGPPGTGKTLLAKAVAGEANVPFFSISGSDFVEMFVGVGASRVRDLFKEANKLAPCIIFIDEIDTIGKSRDNRMGGNDEREQTLNQLLAELDGFDPTKGVIVLAATNRPEVLDKALLRPGRFDRRITIDRPNLAGRLATLQVHTRNIRLAEDVDLNKIALATAGTVGSDLANLVNEAALRAVRKGRKLVTQEDLLASFEFVIAGSEKKNSVLTEFEKKLVAYHEVGHAMVAYKQKNAEPVQKITIVPHTEGSLGYTLLMPEEDKTNLRTKEELMAKITVSMGGRAAEEVVMNTMTNGASQDIQEATNIARNMVAMFGMSEEFGMMALGSVRSQYLDGGYGLDCAQDTAAVMDRAVKAILDVCYAEAVKLIRENREDMDKVAAYLLAKETITGGEMVAIIEGRDPAAVGEAYASSFSNGGRAAGEPEAAVERAEALQDAGPVAEGPEERPKDEE